jgi:hypothetical protein
MARNAMTTSNLIAELMNLVPPPRQPLTNQGDWASVEQSLECCRERHPAPLAPKRGEGPGVRGCVGYRP